MHGKKQYSVSTCHHFFSGRSPTRVTGIQILQLVAWVLRLATSALLLIPRSKPELDPVHLWTEPKSRTARIYSSAMLASEITVGHSMNPFPSAHANV